MPRNVYSEINLHFVRHIKDNAPVLGSSIGRPLYDFLKDRALQTSAVYLHAIGAIEDPVHVVVSVPPTLLISDWIGQVKGSRTTESPVTTCWIGRRAMVWSTLEREICLG